ncbi:hypothetical protein AgCh_028787 [Apium graveolens]
MVKSVKLRYPSTAADAAREFVRIQSRGKPLFLGSQDGESRVVAGSISEHGGQGLEDTTLKRLNLLDTRVGGDGAGPSSSSLRHYLSENVEQEGHTQGFQGEVGGRPEEGCQRESRLLLVGRPALDRIGAVVVPEVEEILSSDEGTIPLKRDVGKARVQDVEEGEKWEILADTDYYGSLCMKELDQILQAKMGEPVKKLRLPLSVSLVQIKKQKEIGQKTLQEAFADRGFCRVQYLDDLEAGLMEESEDHNLQGAVSELKKEKKKLEADQAELERLRKENEELKERVPTEDCVESVKRFWKAKSYSHLFHTYEAYVHAELEKRDNAEDNPEPEKEAGPSAPPQDEFPLSELGVDFEEEAEDGT